MARTAVTRGAEPAHSEVDRKREARAAPHPSLGPGGGRRGPGRWLDRRGGQRARAERAAASTSTRRRAPPSPPLASSTGPRISPGSPTRASNSRWTIRPPAKPTAAAGAHRRLGADPPRPAAGAQGPTPLHVPHRCARRKQGLHQSRSIADHGPLRRRIKDSAHDDPTGGGHAPRAGIHRHVRIQRGDRLHLRHGWRRRLVGGLRRPLAAARAWTGRVRTCGCSRSPGTQGGLATCAGSAWTGPMSSITSPGWTPPITISPSSPEASSRPCSGPVRSRKRAISSSVRLTAPSGPSP